MILSYEDFYEEMWDYISGKVVDDHYFFQNEDMMRAITKDVYDIYCIEDACIHPKYYGRVVESFFFNLFAAQKENKEQDYNRYEFE